MAKKTKKIVDTSLTQSNIGVKGGSSASHSPAHGRIAKTESSEIRIIEADSFFTDEHKVYLESKVRKTTASRAEKSSKGKREHVLTRLNSGKGAAFRLPSRLSPCDCKLCEDPVPLACPTYAYRIAANILFQARQTNPQDAYRTKPEKVEDIFFYDSDGPGAINTAPPQLLLKLTSTLAGGVLLPIIINGDSTVGISGQCDVIVNVPTQVTKVPGKPFQFGLAFDITILSAFGDINSVALTVSTLHTYTTGNRLLAARDVKEFTAAIKKPTSVTYTEVCPPLGDGRGLLVYFTAVPEDQVLPNSGQYVQPRTLAPLPALYQPVGDAWEELLLTKGHSQASNNPNGLEFQTSAATFYWYKLVSTFLGIDSLRASIGASNFGVPAGVPSNVRTLNVLLPVGSNHVLTLAQNEHVATVVSSFPGAARFFGIPMINARNAVLFPYSTTAMQTLPLQTCNQFSPTSQAFAVLSTPYDATQTTTVIDGAAITSSFTLSGIAYLSPTVFENDTTRDITFCASGPISCPADTTNAEDVFEFNNPVSTLLLNQAIGQLLVPTNAHLAIESNTPILAIHAGHVYNSSPTSQPMIQTLAIAPTTTKLLTYPATTLNPRVFDSRGGCRVALPFYLNSLVLTPLFTTAVSAALYKQESFTYPI